MDENRFRRLRRVRLSQKHNLFRFTNGPTLPTNWAYGIPYETAIEGDDESGYYSVMHDYRSPGAQVWEDLPEFSSAAFWHHDGDYGTRGGYGAGLWIRANDYDYSSGSSQPWPSVDVGQVEDVRMFDMKAFEDYLLGLAEAYGDTDRIEEKVGRAVEEHHGEVEKWIRKNSSPVGVNWESTLPLPDDLQGAEQVRDF